MPVLFLVMSVFGTEGTLLCFGKDGHVAVEFVDACNGAGSGSQFAETESDACGPCSDIQFLSDPAYTRDVSQHTQTLPLGSSTPGAPSLPSDDYLRSDINPPDYIYHKAFASLHSVVLLI